MIILANYFTKCPKFLSCGCMERAPCCHPSLKGWSSGPSAAGMCPTAMPSTQPSLLSSLQTWEMHIVVLAKLSVVLQWGRRASNLALQSVCEQMAGELYLPERENTCCRRFRGESSASSAWACKKSWGKKAELFLPPQFPAVFRKEGNRCPPFKTSMSVTTTAWTKTDVISVAVKPDISQTAISTGQCSLRFPSCLLYFLKWRPHAQTQDPVNLPLAQNSPPSSWHLWEKTLHTLRLCWITRKGNFSSSLTIQTDQEYCNLKIGASFQNSKSSPSYSFIIRSNWN